MFEFQLNRIVISEIDSNKHLKNMASDEDISAHKELTENKTEVDTNVNNPDNSDRSKLVSIIFFFCFEFQFYDLGLIL